MNKPTDETQSQDEPSDNDDGTVPTVLRLPLSLKSRIKEYATTHHMTPVQVLVKGMELLMEQEKMERKRTVGRRPQAWPRNKPFSPSERRYLCRLDAVDSCTQTRITWNKYFIRHVEHELESGARPVDVFRSAGVGPEIIGSKRVERCVARWRKEAEKERDGQ